MRVQTAVWVTPANGAVATERWVSHCAE